MTTSATALIAIDIQESFRQRPYWQTDDSPAFFVRQQALIDGVKARGIPILQIFHLADEGPFSLASGYVKTLAEISIAPDALFYKRIAIARWSAPGWTSG